jgi:hypothetical protein
MDELAYDETAGPTPAQVRVALRRCGDVLPDEAAVLRRRLLDLADADPVGALTALLLGNEWREFREDQRRLHEAVKATADAEAAAAQAREAEARLTAEREAAERGREEERERLREARWDEHFWPNVGWLVGAVAMLLVMVIAARLGLPVDAIVAR